MTAESKTELLQPDAAGLRRAVELLRCGSLVAFPTETVYGLGADARNDEAVAAIFAAKGRPAFNPLIVHVADGAAAEEIAVFTPEARALASAFWPGPLTLVLPLRATAGLPPRVTAGLQSVALRVPENAIAHRLLATFGGPLAAPSANLSGGVSATSAAHVLAGLSGRIAAVVDGGTCRIGLESTIVAADGRPKLLRAGGLPVEAIEAALGQSIGFASDPKRPSAPGQLESHYAPAATLRLNATAPEPGEAMLGFGTVRGNLNLSAGSDLHEAASNLFAMLRTLDATGAAKIAVAPVPEHGLGLAINDRLRRAAAPRG